MGTLSGPKGARDQRLGTGAALPLVSIVTPSLNHARFIETTILSVKNQDYPRYEHLVIDGGSTDGTVKILNRYAHLVWCSEADRGQADAVNKGIGRAKGDIIGWLNSDDTFAPGAVRTVVEHFLGHPDVDIVHGDCVELDGNGRPRRTFKGHSVDLERLLLLDFVLYQPAIFFRRRVFDTVGLLDTRLDLAMDYDYLVRAARVFPFYYVPVVLAHHRSSPASKTSTRSRDFLADHLVTLGGVFGDPTLSPAIRRLRRRAYSHAYLAGAVRSYEAGAMSEARTRLLQSLRVYPQPFRGKTLKALLLLLDTVLGLRLGDWTIQRARRLAWRR